MMRGRMMLGGIRLSILLGIVIGLLGGVAPGDEADKDLQAKASSALERSLGYLAKAQDKDGGWHSQTYGQLKGGAAVTSLVLDSFSHAPKMLRDKHAPAINRGFDFFRPGQMKKGTIAAADGSLDYPTYGAALWLSSRRRLKLELPAKERAELLAYLLGAQVCESRGFEKESPSYGGWDFLGQGDAQGITTGTNVSITCYVLESLAVELRRETQGSTAREIESAIRRAEAWTLRCQQPDGGFCFTPEPMSLNNKADFKDEARLQPRSYGTATCDGIRALVACGAKQDDEPVKKAVAWLAERPALELVPGFEGLPPELGWQRGLRFYYYASLAKVLPLLPNPEQTARRKALFKVLVSLQKEDGSFVNESDRMRENDPLIATALATIALGELLQVDKSKP